MTQLAAATRPTLPLRSQVARFAGLSLLSFVCYLGLSAVLHEWVGLPTSIAVAITMIAVTVMNFCTLRLLVFDRTTRGWAPQFVGYVASVAGFRAAEYLAFLLLSGLFAWPYLLALALVLAASVVGKFLFLRGLVFAGPSASKPQAGVAV